MANEASKVELYGTNNSGSPRSYTVADATAITKYTLLALTDPRTAIAQTTSGQAIAGIAAESKEASDGVTRLSVYTDGVFEMVASAAITVGHPVMSANGANYILQATTAASGAAIIGYALETATAGETINVRVKL